LALLVALTFAPMPEAWAGATKVYELKDGTAYVGEVVEELESSILVRTRMGQIVRIEYSDLADISEVVESDEPNLGDDTLWLEGLDTHFSVTVGLTDLVLPVFEVTWEFAILEKHALASVHGQGTIGGYFVDVNGIQYRWYPLGNFDRGLQVGVEELLYGLVADYTVMLSSGVFVGGKYTTGVGFIVEGQVGATSINNFVTPPETALLLNLNIGYAWF